jgi:hypothetical protein
MIPLSPLGTTTMAPTLQHCATHLEEKFSLLKQVPKQGRSEISIKHANINTGEERTKGKTYHGSTMKSQKMTTHELPGYKLKTHFLHAHIN